MPKTTGRKTVPVHHTVQMHGRLIVDFKTKKLKQYIKLALDDIKVNMRPSIAGDVFQCYFLGPPFRTLGHGQERLRRFASNKQVSKIDATRVESAHSSPLNHDFT